MARRDPVVYKQPGNLWRFLDFGGQSSRIRWQHAVIASGRPAADTREFIARFGSVSRLDPLADHQSTPEWRSWLVPVS